MFQKIKSEAFCFPNPDDDSLSICDIFALYTLRSFTNEIIRISFKENEDIAVPPLNQE
jgi:hypothetical protein